MTKLTFTNRSKAVKEIGVSYLGNTAISMKLKKNTKVNGQKTYCIYLSPSNTSGYDVCPFASKECKAGCLATSGRVKMESATKHNITDARVKKTCLFAENTEYFMNWLVAEMQAAKALSNSQGYEFSARLNGTSDIDYTSIKLYGMTIFELFPDVQFYDYTKNAKKFDNKPANYHLTFSYTGRNETKAMDLLSKGFNVAVIFNVGKNKPLPAMYKGYKVIDGDLTDYRPSDERGVIVGLRWKQIKDKAVNETVKQSVMVVQLSDKDIIFEAENVRAESL
jgi:hypothetical protein